MLLSVLWWILQIGFWICIYVWGFNTGWIAKGEDIRRRVKEEQEKLKNRNE